MKAARDHLAAADPALGAFIKKIGQLKLPKPEHTEPYTALLSAVAHQQLHARAAKAILGRLKSRCNNCWPDPETLLALSDADMRACGFSANKTAALRDIASKAAAGTIPTSAAARRLSDADLINRLVTIRGVGQWTVEMLLIFTLKRPDVFPVDDFGVREGYRILHNLPTQPKPKPLAQIATAYAPHRATAARYLWRIADLAKPPAKESKQGKGALPP
jgi:DNA-3-methyladenine glycosylase II